MQIKLFLAMAGLAALGFPVLAPVRAQTSSATASTPSPVDPAALKRWQDARYGMFIHWGPISQLAQEISWSRGKEVPTEQYDNLYKTFDPEKFNADDWVKIARGAGMKYIVLVCKHHDGFCMWDTRETDYNIMHTPFKRDIVKELSDACHKQGMPFGCYYSTTDWYHPDFPLTGPGGSVRREHSDLDKYTDYLKAQIRELLTQYGPIFTLWFDVPQEFDAKRGQSVIDFARSIQPEIVINDRTGAAGDYSTPEQHLGDFNRERPWESCMTISAHNHWIWGGDSDGVKSLGTILELLIRCAGGDGNMLLNVGPQPNGEINAEQVARLKEVGAWLAQYGESIYGTRGGPYKPGPWGVSTCKGNVVYLHILKWTGDSLVLPPLGRKIVKSELLTGGAVRMEQDDQGLTVSVAPSDRQETDTLVKLELDGSAMDIPPIADLSGSIAKGRPATASNVFKNDPAYAAGSAFDDDAQTRWATDSGTTQAWLQVDLGQPMKIARVAIDEAEGDRVQSFELQYKDGDQWQTFYSGTTIGSNFTTNRFTPMTARYVRLHILQATDGPSINEFQLFSR
jgi:alpha-L-fucosidase